MTTNRPDISMKEAQELLQEEHKNTMARKKKREAELAALNASSSSSSSSSRAGVGKAGKAGAAGDQGLVGFDAGPMQPQQSQQHQQPMLQIQPPPHQLMQQQIHHQQQMHQQQPPQPLPLPPPAPMALPLVAGGGGGSDASIPVHFSEPAQVNTIIHHRSCLQELLLHHGSHGLLLHLSSSSTYPPSFKHDQLFYKSFFYQNILLFFQSFLLFSYILDQQTFCDALR